MINLSLELRKFSELTINFDKERIPLSSSERETKKGKYPYYGAQGIIDSLDEYIFDGEYLLIAEDGENLNSRSQPIANVVSGKFWVNNHAHIVKTNSECDIHYLCYLLNNTNISGYITGSAQPKLNQYNLNNMVLEIQDYETQCKISKILKGINNKIKLNDEINKNLQELAKSIYRYHFIDFEPYSQGNFISTTLGEIPENWSVQLIEEFVDDMKNGGTPKRGEPDYWDNGTIPWLKTGEINNNIIIKSEEHITELGLKNSSAKLLPINSIIMALYGKGTAARIGLLKHEATTNQACCAMICNDFNKTLFLYLFLLFNQKEIENLASGSVQQNLSKDLIANLELVVPPIELIEKLPFKEIYDKISNNYFEIEYLTNLRDTLLPKLMSGELDVSEINCDLE